ncbi:MAG: DUF72 domain-containing protein, partial [Thermomicrobiaceae bacterium]|nr:DUF72 domain-containing protein [Thermomicrobiaceae bacterium]
MGKLLIGTSAWSDHDPFYPPGLKPSEQLSFYARYFPIVEVNTTYYRVPSRRMVEGWVERTPPGFVFDVKPPRELTSTPETPKGEPPTPDADLAAAFAEAISPLAEAGKLGAVTFQFPPSYRNTEEHREYLRLLPELLPEYPISVEFRRRDWLDEEHAEETLDLLAETGLSYTMVDEPQMGTGSVPPIYAVTNPRLAVVRFHGRNYETWYKFTGSSRERFDWEYSEEELAEWRPKIEAALQAAEAVHVFFNTNRADQGPRNAAKLMDLL